MTGLGTIKKNKVSKGKKNITRKEKKLVHYNNNNIKKEINKIKDNNY